jgi:hypothetical protein
MLRFAPLPLVALALLAGCGSSSSSKSNAGQAESAVRRYFAAVGAGRAAEACALLTPAAKQRLRRGASCEQLVTAAHAYLSPQAQAGFRAVKLGTPKLSGNEAKIKATISGQSSTVVLTNKSGAWLIEAP